MRTKLTIKLEYEFSDEIKQALKTLMNANVFECVRFNKKTGELTVIAYCEECVKEKE